MVNYTIHRPTRGWYIRIRRAGQTRGSIVPLLAAGKGWSEGSLVFNCRTYPSSASGVVYPPTPNSGNADSMVSSHGTMKKFVLSPLIIPANSATDTSASIWSRMLSFLQTTSSSLSTSFTLSHFHPNPQSISTSTPLMTFADITPTLRLSSSSGTLTISSELRREGLDDVFWVSVAMAYMSFVGEREGWLAATTDWVATPEGNVAKVSLPGVTVQVHCLPTFRPLIWDFQVIQARTAWNSSLRDYCQLQNYLWLDQCTGNDTIRQLQHLQTHWGQLDGIISLPGRIRMAYLGERLLGSFGSIWFAV